MRTLAVDFDGVLHQYSRGWADGTIYDPPLPGAIEGLRALMQRYTVCVHTTRDVQQVADWLSWYAIPTVTYGEPPLFWDVPGLVLVTNRKIAAVAYIDDRAYYFRDWQQTLADWEDVG